MTADEQSTAATDSPESTGAIETDPSRWVDEHGDALFRYALPRAGTRDVAEELVQETFLAALEAKDRFAARSSVRTWLVGILRNKIIDHIRRASRERKDAAAPHEHGGLEAIFDERGAWRRVPGDWSDGPLSPTERDELRRAIDQCARLLPPGLADVFVLREIEQMDTDSVCQVLGITPTNLWTRIHRLRMMLRQCLEQRWLEKNSSP